MSGKQTYCSCWVEYPNENHRKQNGHSKCDNYECIRQLECRKTKDSFIDIPVRKTKCVKKKEV